MVDGIIDIMVTWSTPHPEMAGRMLADIAAEWGCTQQEACERLQPGGACYFQMREDDVQRVLEYPATMIGSDGLPHDQHPHPRLWGTFPRVLGHYSRDLGLFSLETAVHKMSGLSARNFQLDDRGEIREGAYADIVVFDAATVKDVATFEQPKALVRGHRMRAGERRDRLSRGTGCERAQRTVSAPDPPLTRHETWLTWYMASR